MKILIADDSRTMRRVFRTLLESLGHAPGDILECNDAIEAIAQLKSLKYAVDYIIADFDMAGMENHGFLNRLKHDSPDKSIPILLCINANQRMVASEALKKGATMLLERPFRDGDARQKLQTIEAGLKAKKAAEASQYLKTIVSAAEAEIDLPFLMQLPSLVMKEFLQLSARTLYEAGETIYKAGDKVDALYVVTLGDVELIPQADGNAEMIREGEAFGELAFMSGERSSATARAHSMSQVVSLPRHKLAELINHQPRMSQHLSALVARRTKLQNKPPSPGNTEFSGNLSSMSFADVLQLLQVGRKTGYITLESLGRKGEIGIESGEVRQARAENQTGDDAFYSLAAWKGATFAFNSTPLKDAPNVVTPTMPLLMEAMRRVDEAGRASDSPPPDAGEKSLKDLF
jgi:CRP-like cAMP-binding protein/FixJ family two-component response regulator